MAAFIANAESCPVNAGLLAVAGGVVCSDVGAVAVVPVAALFESVVVVVLVVVLVSEPLLQAVKAATNNEQAMMRFVFFIK